MVKEQLGGCGGDLGGGRQVQKQGRSQGPSNNAPVWWMKYKWDKGWTWLSKAKQVMLKGHAGVKIALLLFKQFFDIGSIFASLANQAKW